MEVMKSRRIHLRERTEQLLDDLLLSSTEEQMAFFGIDSEETLQVELEKIQKNKSNSYSAQMQWDLIEISSQKVMGSCGFHN